MRGIKRLLFFCIGQNIEKYPEKFRSIIAHGHIVGYHSYSHESNWGMSYKNILEDHNRVAKLFSSKLYRPPYGRLSLRLLYYLKERGIQTILWTVLSEDWKVLKDPIAVMQKKLNKAP